MSQVDRRRFLKGSLATLGAGGIGAAVGAGVAEQGTAAASAPPSAEAQAEQVNVRALNARVPFDGPHQAGILTPAPDQATWLALDSVAPDRGTLLETLQAISTQARLLTQGESVGVAEVEDPRRTPARSAQ